MEQTSQGFSDTLLRKKDLKALHPRKDYHIDGEILPTHKETRAQDLRALPLCKYLSLIHIWISTFPQKARYFQRISMIWEISPCGNIP